jgi:hypothetical protein
VSDDARRLFPELESTWPAGGPKAEIAVLSDDDYRRLLARFGFAAGADEPPREAFSLQVDAGGVRAAARSREGFIAAIHRLSLLDALGAGRCPGHLPRCIMLDYPVFPVRAVRLIPARPRDIRRMEPFARVVAALGYNTLHVSTDDCGPLDADGTAFLDGLAVSASLHVSVDQPLPEEIATEFDGPSILDWEHAAHHGMRGACLTYRGEMDVDAMAGQGFLYNLAYSATMLWNRDYNNFSWEKTAEATEEFLPYLVGMMREETRGWGDLDELDAFPLLAHPVELRPQSSQELVGDIDSQADALVFRHALPASPHAAGAPERDGEIGAYLVRYAGGAAERVALAENRTVGRCDIWCGRRYDPLLSRFRTDPRLRSLACFTRPRKTAGHEGALELTFDFEWRNPTPERPVERILWEPRHGPGGTGLHVEQVTLIRKLAAR